MCQVRSKDAIGVDGIEMFDWKNQNNLFWLRQFLSSRHILSNEESMIPV